MHLEEVKDMLMKHKRILTQLLAVLVAVISVVFLQRQLRSGADAQSKAAAENVSTGLAGDFLADAIQAVPEIKEEQLEEDTAETEEEAEETSAVILSEVWDGGNYYNVDGTLQTPDINAIMGKSITTAEQLVDYYVARGNTYPAYYARTGSSGAATIETFCQIIIEEATAEGVRPEVVFMQTMKETGWLTFTGDVRIEQYNFAGIGATGGGEPGNSFADIRTGIRAQVQHLKAYASDEPLNNECIDPRFEYVTRASSPYIEWLGIQENPNGGGWAADQGYGGAIVNMIRELN